MISSLHESVSVIVDLLFGLPSPYSGSPDIPFIMSVVLVIVFLFDLFHLIGVLFRGN